MCVWERWFERERVLPAVCGSILGSATNEVAGQLHQAIASGNRIILHVRIMFFFFGDKCTVCTIGPARTFWRDTCHLEVICSEHQNMNSNCCYINVCMYIWYFWDDPNFSSFWQESYRRQVRMFLLLSSWSKTNSLLSITDQSFNHSLMSFNFVDEYIDHIWLIFAWF